MPTRPPRRRRPRGVLTAVSVGALALAALTPSATAQPDAPPDAPVTPQEPAPTLDSEDAALPAPTRTSPFHVGSSPFDPGEPTDSRFIVDEAPDLDTGCTYRSGGPLEFDIEVDRVLGDDERDALLANGLLTDTVTLRMPAYDIDAIAPPGYAPELDRVSFNGNVVPGEYLTGSDQTWKMNTFSIPVDWVNFATDPGAGGTAEPVANTIRIDIDTANTEEIWCTSIDWAELSVDMPRPTVFAHGIFSSGDIWDVTWAPRLRDLGVYTDTTLDMGALDSIQDNAVKIQAAVDADLARYGVDKVNVVAHSKGGLDGRHYVEGTDTVDRFVQLGTPNAGSPLANWLQGIAVAVAGPGETLLINQLAGGGGVQLTTPYMSVYNQHHTLNPEVEFTALAGDYSAQGCFCLKERLLLLVTGTGDTIVPVESVHAFAAMDHATFASQGEDKDATHSGLHSSVAIYEQLRDIVTRPGRATASPQPAAASGQPLAVEAPTQTIPVGGLLTPGGAEQTFPIDQVTPTFVSVLYPEAGADVALITPSGERIEATGPGVEVESGEIPGGAATVFNLESPEVGVWEVDVAGTVMAGGAEGAPSAQDAGFALTSSPVAPEVTWTPTPTTAFPQVGEAEQLQATLLDDDAPLTDAESVAVLMLPDGDRAEVAMRDDGVAPDAAADDGIYTGEFVPEQAGPHQALLTASGTRADGAPFSRSVPVTILAADASATLTGLTDAGVDDDANGLFDRLEINGTLAVDEAGDYRVLAELVDSAGTVHEASAEVSASGGSAPLSLSFDGRALYDAGIDGPYTLGTVRVAERAGDDLVPVAEIADAHVTSAYAADEFEHDALRLTGEGRTEGVDLDGNGLFDELVVGIGVETDVPGWYEWTATLRDDQGTEIGFAAGSGQIDADGEFELTFAGEPIGANVVDGPYRVADLLLYGMGTDLIEAEAYITDPLRADQFEGFPSSVQRIGGDDRYETAALVAEGSPLTGQLFVGSGRTFPDALALAAQAASDDGALLLTRPDLVPVATVGEIGRQVGEYGPQPVDLAGGTGAIGAAVEARLGDLAGGVVTRHGGTDRYATAASIAEALVEPGSTAYVVSGVDYPDALTSATLAGPDGGSVLLTKPESLPSATAAQLTRQQPERIVVVGGTAAVSDAVLTELEAYAPEVTRRSGDDRYGTAAALTEMFEPDVPVLYVATGENYPDALAVGGLAGRQGAPLLLTKAGELPETTAEAIERLEPRRIVVVGGEASISPEVVALLDGYLD